MALFRRAGNQLPASSGVCGSLSLAHSSVQQAVSALGHEDNAPGPLAAKAIQLREAATDWVTVIDSMIADYQCQYPMISSILFRINGMEARRMTGRKQLRIGTDDG